MKTSYLLAALLSASLLVGCGPSGTPISPSQVAPANSKASAEAARQIRALLDDPSAQAGQLLPVYESAAPGFDKLWIPRSGMERVLVTVEHNGTLVGTFAAGEYDGPWEGEWLPGRDVVTPADFENALSKLGAVQAEQLRVISDLDGDSWWLASGLGADDVAVCIKQSENRDFRDVPEVGTTLTGRELFDLNARYIDAQKLGG